MRHEKAANLLELARMLAGLEESTSAADQARELLDLAHSERSTS